MNDEWPIELPEQETVWNRPVGAIALCSGATLVLGLVLGWSLTSRVPAPAEPAPQPAPPVSRINTLPRAAPVPEEATALTEGEGGVADLPGGRPRRMPYVVQ